MASRDPSTPNVLFILSDDQGAWALGAAGNDEIHTPHLDELARTGTRFERFYCASPVCSPARASLLTSQAPSQHGVHDWIAAGHHGPDGADFLAGRALVTDELAGVGYRCGLSGKWHLGASDRPRAGFVHWYAHASGGSGYYDAPMIRDDGPVERAPGYLTDVLADDAIDFIESEAERDEPFWASLHFTAPHSPWKDNHPRSHVDRYDDCEFRTCPQEPPHPWLRYHPDGYPTQRGEDLRAALQGYYGAITAMDEAIGRVLAVLKSRDLRSSTLVVFTSDNGFNCGHHGVWGKGNGTYPQNMYESSVTVPAIFSQPGRVVSDQVIRTPATAYDLAPTIVDWVGHAEITFDSSPGRSLAPLLAGTGDGEQPPVVVVDEYGPTRMIRDGDWKLVRYGPAAAPSLFDLDRDPQERTDVASRHPDIVARLTQSLESWFATYAHPDHDGDRPDVAGFGQLAPLESDRRPSFAEPHETTYEQTVDRIES